MSLSETMGLRSVWEEAFHSFPHKSLSVVGRIELWKIKDFSTILFMMQNIILVNNSLPQKVLEILLALHFSKLVLT